MLSVSLHWPCFGTRSLTEAGTPQSAGLVGQQSPGTILSLSPQPGECVCHTSAGDQNSVLMPVWQVPLTGTFPQPSRFFFLGGGVREGVQDRVSLWSPGVLEFTESLTPGSGRVISNKLQLPFPGPQAFMHPIPNTQTPEVRDEVRPEATGLGRRGFFQLPLPGSVFRISTFYLQRFFLSLQPQCLPHTQHPASQVHLGPDSGFCHCLQV